MAQLWLEQGKSRRARELLAPVYGWFIEGFDTRDLMDHKGAVGGGDGVIAWVGS